MSCEQVEEMLSAYLDNMLAREERDSVALHLKRCPSCRNVLADFSRFDNLLRHMPRVNPGPELREKIFSSPEYADIADALSKEDTVPVRSLSQPAARREREERPRLTSIPGGRASNSAPTTPHPSLSRESAIQRYTAKHSHWSHRAMQLVAAAALLLTLGMGGFIAWRLGQQQAKAITNTAAITPPAALQTGPLPAGTRFVFLRNGALWSGATDGSKQVVQLTLKNVTVAPHWVVRPALPGHTAGNLVAYIDAQHGAIHILRSDGQTDTIIQQPLFKVEVSSTIWNTQVGQAIANSLSWSPDGNTLAFVAAPVDAAQSSLYFYTLSTGKTYLVPLPSKGLVSRPTWSADGTRIAVASTHAGNVDILDYNLLNKSILSITNIVDTVLYPHDTLLSLYWSSRAVTPELTWSVGTPGQIHSIWVHSIGAAKSSTLAMGNFTQASYNPTASHGIGAWLLASSQSGQASFLRQYDLDMRITTLASGKQVGEMNWSADGTMLSYLDITSISVGTLHTITISTGVDSIVAIGVEATPAPAWSVTGHMLVYSVGTQSFVFDQQKVQQLPLQGSASAFSWSPTYPAQFVISLATGQMGTYLVTIQDAQHTAVTQVDTLYTSASLLWTQIP